MKQEELHWQFGGGLQALPPPAAWVLLGFLFAAAALLAWWTYGRTLLALPTRRRAALVSLRALGLLAIFLCLANPSLLIKQFSRDSATKRYAVVVDRSESMLMPDNRRETRFDRAWSCWLKSRPRPGERVELSYYVLGAGLSPVSSEDAARAAEIDGRKTALHASLAELLSSGGRFDEIFCLTDGVDTADGKADVLLGQALAARVPLSFLPGENRLRPQPTLRLLEFTAPARALKNTEFTVFALLELWSEKGGQIPVRLNRGGKLASQQTLTVGAGRSVRPVAFPVSAGDPGLLELEIDAGEGDVRANHRTLVSVRDKMPVRILFYQGALDWGYRFFARSLKSDPSFELDVIFSPQTGVLRPASRAPAALTAMPADARRLAGYDLVILSQVFPGQLDAAQQGALRDYVRQGGAVLFNFSSSRSVQDFQKSVLEQILPVVFAPPTPDAADDLASRAFQERMKQTSGGSSMVQETAFAAEESQRPLEREMSAFAFGAQTPLSDLFKGEGGEKIVPAYTEAAPIYGTKPAAEVLAVAGDDGGEPRILLALQYFGRGRSALLATDMLWSWTLAQPSSSRLASTFWQQFVTWLAQPGNRGFDFLEPPLEAAKGQTVRFRFTRLPDPRLVKVGAISPSGVRVDLPLAASREGENFVELQPAETGLWTVSALGTEGDMIERTVTVVDHLATAERSATPADLAGMERLANATGGRVIRQGEKLSPTGPERKEPLLVRQSVQPLWNTWGLLLAILGAFSAELLLRRRWKLL